MRLWGGGERVGEVGRLGCLRGDIVLRREWVGLARETGSLNLFSNLFEVK